MMNILVLMAGSGSRFSEKGYSIPKPMINVKGKTILQWTTESCPYINHNTGKQNNSINLCFAVLAEHLKTGLSEHLYNVYGNNINIIPFEKVTRGNLDTARIACSQIDSKNDPILILDSDNKYNNNGMDEFIKSLPNDLTTMAICCFENVDKTLPNKWSNARVKDGFALEIREKENLWKNYPSLIGVFYFSKVDQFKNYADFIMSNLEPVGFKDRKEYYMSMIPTYHAKIGQPVHVHFVTDVVSLGTPENVEAFANT